MNNPEIILNLWYVHDEMGIIYSLRARAYVGIGSDQEKLAFLRKFSSVDYLIAKPFPIPQCFQVQILPKLPVKNVPVTHVNVLQSLDSNIVIFEDAIKQLESDLPAQSNLSISKTPLVCITPLLGEENGKIKVHFTNSRRLEDF